MRQIFTLLFLKGLLLFTFFMPGSVSFAQPCSVTINSFPYNEGFETTDGNWASGGTASDWAWGTPAKPVITAAGAGNRCWITGGLTSASYNNSENSWLQSPCFDFSTLLYPQISFKIFWETERRFDGASFQYSIDGGATWQLLGSANSNTNCQGENWYNTPAITYLGNITGWSGNIQANSGSCLGGSGSATWLTARHSLSALAGQANVRFRFLFGAGSTCNAYDGFAVDDIQIGEAPANTASFSNTCVSDKEISVTSVATCAQSYSWNFGDPGSGVSNTSSVANTTHTFSAPGTYNVTLVTGFVNGPPVTTSKEVVIIGLTPDINWPGRCSGIANATLSLSATGSNTPYFYNWDTNPAQTTPSIINQGPGNYTVTVSSLNACSNNAYFGLDNPVPIVINPSVTDASCEADNGSITANVIGGKAPYQYTWSTGDISSSIQNLAPGNYTLQVRDANACSVTSGNISVNRQLANIPVSLGPDAFICTGQSLVLNPGPFSNYLWQDNSGNSTFTVTSGGIYFVKVTNAAGCTGVDTVIVKEDCSNIYFPSAFTPNNDGNNDGFGPLGNLSGITNYSLSVYNRYGQRIFLSNDPFKKWDGTFKGDKFNTGSFVWMASFLFNGKLQSAKGAVTLIR